MNRIGRIRRNDWKCFTWSQETLIPKESLGGPRTNTRETFSNVGFLGFLVNKLRSPFRCSWVRIQQHPLRNWGKLNFKMKNMVSNEMISRCECNNWQEHFQTLMPLLTKRMFRPMNAYISWLKVWVGYKNPWNAWLDSHNWTRWRTMLVSCLWLW